MKKTIAALCIAGVLAGCANTTANPVQLAQIGDETKSCRAIMNEMQEMRNSSLEAEGDRNKQVAANVALGVTGLFLIVPWFFMDTGNAATVEQKAALARYKRLQTMGEERQCQAVAPVAMQPSAALK